ncbi:MAG: hypothetical protein FWF97_02230 [Alphaproteobacteria bacterium]|nr:hypothetical protein [Alphaproteobacteria bacterium]
MADGRWSECMLYPDGKGWIHPNYSSKHPTDISTLDTGMSDQGWTWSCKKGTKYDSASNTCKFDPSTCKVPTGYPNANNTGCVICADLEPKGTKILSSDGKSCVADPAKCADANGQVIGGECEVCPPNFKTAGGNSCVIDPDQCKKPYKYIKTVAGVQSCVDCSEQGKIVNDALNDCQMDPATCKAPGAYMDGSTCRQCEPGKKAVTGRKGWGPLCMIPLPAGHGYIAPHTNATTEYCPTLAHGNGSVYQKIIEDICVKCGLQGYIKDSSQYLGDGFDSSKTNCAKLTVIDSLKFEACAQTSLDKKSFQECVMK